MNEDENELILAQDKAQDKAQDEIVNEKISNMNEEEKKAIEIVKEIKDIRGMRQDVEGEDEDLWALDTLINLINKQQKEIEELKHDNSILCEIAYTGKRIQLPYTMVYTGTDNFISKDKIKEKMRGEINKSWRNTEQRKCQLYAYDILKELLGE